MSDYEEQEPRDDGRRVVHEVPVTCTVQVTLDDQDIESNVVTALVNRLSRKIEDTEVRATIIRGIQAKVEERLEGLVQLTDRWGGPQGPLKSMRELAMDIIEGAARAKVTDDGVPTEYYGAGTWMQYLVKKVVKEDLAKEMKKVEKEITDTLRAEMVVNMEKERAAIRERVAEMMAALLVKA